MRRCSGTNLEIAICIQEEIGGFQITVDNVRAVQCLERSKCLVDEVLCKKRSDVRIIVPPSAFLPEKELYYLCMIIRQILRTNDTVHVGFHQLLDHYDNKSLSDAH